MERVGFLQVFNHEHLSGVGSRLLPTRGQVTKPCSLLRKDEGTAREKPERQPPTQLLATALFWYPAVCLSWDSVRTLGPDNVFLWEYQLRWVSVLATQNPINTSINSTGCGNPTYRMTFSRSKERFRGHLHRRGISFLFL